MTRIVRISFAIIRQDSKIASLRDAEPSSLLFSLEISSGEDLLVVRMPPMRPARGTKNEFVAVIEDNEGVGGMCGGYKNDTHGCRRLFIVSLRMLNWIIFKSLSVLYASEMGEGASHDGSGIYKVSGTHHLGPDSWVIVA
jgi:hypothetical protein